MLMSVFCETTERTNLVELVDSRRDGTDFILWHPTDFEDTIKDFSVIELDRRW